MADRSEEGLYPAAASGEPFLDHLLLDAPAAGAQVTLALDSTWEWRILSVRSTLTTSAAVANRFPSLRVQDAEGNVYFESMAQPAITASVTNARVNFNDAAEFAGAGATVESRSGVPHIWVPGGWELNLQAIGMDAGDTFGVTRLLVLKRLSC